MVRKRTIITNNGDHLLAATPIRPIASWDLTINRQLAIIARCQAPGSLLRRKPGSPLKTNQEQSTRDAFRKGHRPTFRRAIRSHREWSGRGRPGGGCRSAVIILL